MSRRNTKKPLVCSLPECPENLPSDATLQCDQCKKWIHMDCATRIANVPGLDNDLQAALRSETVTFRCAICNPKGPNLLQLLYDAGLLSTEQATAKDLGDYLTTATGDCFTTATASNSSGDFVTAQTATTLVQPGSTSTSLTSSTLEALLIQIMARQEADSKRQEALMARQEADSKRQEALMARQEADSKRQEALFTALLGKLTSEPTLTTAPAPAPAPVPVPPPALPQINPYLKLTKIDVPTYDGCDLTAWPAFWDQFNYAYHQNTTIAAEAKMLHLLQRLTGKAKGAVKGLTVSAANYEIAIQILQKRYGSPEEISDRLYKKLDNLPQVHADGRNLDDFVNTVEAVLRQLTTLGKPLDPCYRLIYSKLNATLLQSFDEHQFQMASDKPRIQMLQDFLERRLNMQLRHRHILDTATLPAAPRSVSTNQAVPSLNNPSQQDIKNNNGGKGKSQRQSSFQPQTVPETFECTFCHTKGRHWSHACDLVADFSKRWEILRKERRCYSCLGKFGNSSTIQQHKIVCRGRLCPHCPDDPHHHAAICPKRRPTAQPPALLLPDTTPESVMSNHNQDTGQSLSSPLLISADPNRRTLKEVPQVHMMIAKGYLGPSARQENYPVTILLDSGSRYSYITTATAKGIKAQNLSRLCTISVAQFGGHNSETHRSRRVKFSLQTATVPKSSIELVANTIDKITTPLTSEPLSLPEDLLPRLQGKNIVNFATTMPDSYSIDLVIGADHYNDIVFSAEHISPSLTLNDTALGYLLFGTAGDTKSMLHHPSLVTPILLNDERTTEDCISTLWDLEKIGIQDDPHTSDDDMAISQFADTVRYVNNRYYVHWPWRNLATTLSDNYHLARERLRRFQKSQLMTNTLLRKNYHETILEQLKKGIIEEVPHDEVMTPRFLTHYIPHHAVIKETSHTTKLRVVYDASAKTATGTSLNQHLLRGPVILANLIGLLLRFRLWLYVSVSDVEKAFLQVALDESQRDVCRFIWLKDPTFPHSKENQIIYRFCRVPFGMVSSPFLLGATIQHHLKLCNTWLSDELLENIYVDNVIYGTKSEEELTHYYKEAKEIFSKASMNLREWSSNSPRLQSQLPDEEKGPTDEIKVLGLKWNPTTDNLKISGWPTALPTPKTKRTFLHTLAKVFDPLGLLSPVVIPRES